MEGCLRKLASVALCQVTSMILIKATEVCRGTPCELCRYVLEVTMCASGCLWSCCLTRNLLYLQDSGILSLSFDLAHELSTLYCWGHVSQLPIFRWNISFSLMSCLFCFLVSAKKNVRYALPSCGNWFGWSLNFVPFLMHLLWHSSQSFLLLLKTKM